MLVFKKLATTLVMLATLIATSITTSVQAMPTGKPFDQLKSKEYTLHSKAMDQSRRIIVSLPSDYYQGESEFPVLYLLDGMAFTTGATAIVRSLAEFHAIPDLIVVAVEQHNRRAELAGNQSAHFGQFIELEVLPFIQENYRTAGMNILYGHSLGGSFAIQTMLSGSGNFNAYLAVSPVITDTAKQLSRASMTHLDNGFKSNPNKRTFVYLVKGNETEANFNNTQDFAKSLNAHTDGKLIAHYQTFDDDSHGTVPLPALHYGLKKLFHGWIMPQVGQPGNFAKLTQLEAIGGLEAIEQYYRQYSIRIGYDVTMPAILFSRVMWMLFHAGKHQQLMALIKSHGKGQSVPLYYLGHRYFNNQQIEKGIEVFKLDTTHHANTPSSWAGLAYGYQLAKDFGQAKAHYQKAITLAQSNNDPRLKEYQKALAELNH